MNTTATHYDLQQDTTLQQISSLDKAQLSAQLVEAYIRSDCMVHPSSQRDAVTQWRNLLTLILILKKQDSLASYFPMLVNTWRQMRAATPWIETQLINGYIATIDALLREGRGTMPFWNIQQLPNGACPYRTSDYSHEGRVPHPLYHAELGGLLFLFAHVTQSESHRQAAFRLVEWQKMALDHNWRPFVGLYACESEGDELSLLHANDLLFTAAAAMQRSDEAWSFAQQIRKAMPADSAMPLYNQILLSFFPAAHDESAEQKTAGKGAFCDPDLSLAGFRSETTSAVATLSGDRTGMGCWHGNGVRIVNYGPHYPPLSDCNDFGIVGCIHPQTDPLYAITTGDSGFTLKGTVRILPASPDRLPFWIETNQTYIHDSLTIETKIKGGDASQTIGFTFFASCHQCKTRSGRILKSRSLDRYQGKVESLILTTSDSEVELHANGPYRELHVIPLAGGKDFWGADFLISYTLPESDDTFAWKILKIT